MNKYKIIEKIYDSESSLVYRARIESSDLPVILKILKEKYCTVSEIARYKQEYEITRSFDSDFIVKTYGLHRYENSLALLTEDFGGQSLISLISQRSLALEEFLSISVDIIDGLRVIHAANIIHKDINPSNIVYNPNTKQVKIIDFGSSTRLSKETQKFYNSQQIEGTLSYIAPEQTGRMNRVIDYRSDFYSFGVSCYELLTQTLPFEASDLIELIHCHIAQTPENPHERLNSIPLILSRIIMKLLSKNPEERYQSAIGIRADFEECLQRLQNQGKISQFPLCRQDFSDRFNIPQNLYGREQEIIHLFNSFERVSQGTSELLLISGNAGIGKTALVDELHRPITKTKSYFLRGKFEELKRDIPYFAISQAFKGFVLDLLSQSEAQLSTWRKEILDVVGKNGQIIINIIPELENIIGKQPPAKQRSQIEDQNRFNSVFKKFVGIFSAKQISLIMFIDDLQWADLPSLQLIEELITDPDLSYLLIIGAYRDNEISISHPLNQVIEHITKSKTLITQLTLLPINLEHITQFILDTFHNSIKSSQVLAKLLANKSGGNPFFLIQLLSFFIRKKIDSV